MVSSISSSYFSTSLMQLSQQLFKSIDSDGDGSTTKTQLQELSDESSSLIDKFFSKVDTNTDGALTEQEFTAALSQLFHEMKSSMNDAQAMGVPPPPPDSSQMISSMDMNGDGALSVDEMTAGGVPDVETIFSKIDTDGDGLASANELDAYAETMKTKGEQEVVPQPPPQHSGEMFSSLDTDGDGYLTVEEMKTGGIPDAEKIFSDIDTDGDGLVSQAESAAFEDKMKANVLQTSTGENGSVDLTSFQMELLNQLIALITQYSSGSAATASTSVIA